MLIILAVIIVSMFIGKDLKDDPEYQARLKAGLIPPPNSLGEQNMIPGIVATTVAAVTGLFLARVMF